MIQIPEISVSPYEGQAHVQGEMPTHSALFRGDTQLPAVLATRLSAEAESPLRIASIGASFGAEADSALVYALEMAPRIGRITLTGFDINERTVSQAQRGKYLATVASRRTEHGRVPIDLAPLVPMLDVTPTGEASYGQYVVDTNRMRQQHNVTFAQRDILAEPPTMSPQDIILCNNMLFHLTAEKAEAMLQAMATMLAPGGVLSIGANPKQLRMSGNRDSTDYIGWRHAMAEKLAVQGIGAVLYDKARKAPFVFRRDA